MQPASAQGSNPQQQNDANDVTGGTHREDSTKPKGAPMRPRLSNRRTQNLPAFLQGAVQRAEAFQVPLMAGEMSNLPERNSRTVRVFISSTFSDMHVERNVLMRYVYPELKESCLLKYGLAFQIVDMRWGIQDGASLDQMASEICFREIQLCQETSVGPHFLALLGHRYGTKKLPYTVEKTVLENLMQQMSDTAALELTEKWYRKDDNQLEPVYVLQPVLLSPASGKAATFTWEKEEKMLLNILENASREAVKSGKIDEAEALVFCSSVTDQEVTKGIITCKADRRPDTLLCIRELTDVRDLLKSEVADVSRFIETTIDGQVNESTVQRLEEIKICLKSGAIPYENIMEYKTTYGSVADTESMTRTEYETKLAADLKLQLQILIDRAIERISELESDSLYSEVLQHSHQCVSSVRQFQGREDTMSQVRRYIESEARHPLMIHGASGCGKTSVMARAANLARQWLPESDREGAIVIIRFLGTSPSSSSIRQTLRSICQQMAVVLGTSEVTDSIQEIDFREIVNNFYKLAEKLCQQSRKVLIFLDSVDQLDASDGAHTLGWLRPNLPTGIKIVLSSLPDMFDILDSCRSLLRDIDSSECFVEICELNPELCCHIVRDMLTERGRCLTEPQWCVLRAAFEKCSLPIYMNLVFNQVMAWNSYTPVDSHSLEYTVRGAIEHLFNRLERQHGQLLVSHALAYITASRSGLGEGEIEDLLSLDEEVLGEVFAHHLPPFIRLPPLCWTRVRHEIGPYLVEREADEARVLTWYHRQFWEVCRDRYFSNAEFMRQTHSRLADYFLGVWSDRPKPFKCPPNLAAKLARQGTPPPSEADRQVPQQPHVLQRDDSGSVRFNLRKLSELPFHLLRSGRIDDFHDHVTFNMDFLESKLSATSHHLLLRDLQLFFDVDESVRGSGSDSVDAERLFNAMRIAGPSLSHSPLCLPVDLCGRLRSFAESSSRIRKLLSDCRHRDQSTCILPLNGCFDSGSSYTHCAIQNHLSVSKLCENNKFYTIGISGLNVTWYDQDGVVWKSVTCDRLPVLHIGLMPVLSSNGCFLTVDKDITQQHFKLYRGNLLTGVWKCVLDFMPSEIPENFYNYHDPVLAAWENHIVLRRDNFDKIEQGLCIVLKPSLPTKSVWLVATKTSPPLLSKDLFLFYVGSVVPPSWTSGDSFQPSFRPRALVLENFQEVNLPSSEFDSGLLINFKAFVRDNDILLVTSSKVSLESTAIVFTIRRFVVDAANVVEDVCSQVESEHDPGDNYNVTMSLDRMTIAICFTCVRESMGFLLKLPHRAFVPLAFQPILRKSVGVVLSKFSKVQASTFQLFLSHNGEYLLSKTRSHFMFNIWSGRDGSFLAAIPFSSRFYCLGQIPGTDLFLINTIPVSIANSACNTIVVNLNKLATSSAMQGSKVTAEWCVGGTFSFSPHENSLVSFYFDRHLGGSAAEMSLESGAMQDILKLPLELSDPTAEAIDQIEARFSREISMKLKSRSLHPDIREFGLELFQAPGSLQMRIADAETVLNGGFDGTDKSLTNAVFNVKHFSGEYKVNDVTVSGSDISDFISKFLNERGLNFVISNHRALDAFPLSYLMASELPHAFSRTSVVPAVLSTDERRLHLLLVGNAKPPARRPVDSELAEVAAPKESANSVPSSSESEQSRLPEEEVGAYGKIWGRDCSLLCSVDVANREMDKCLSLPVLEVGDAFIKFAGRQVAVETVRKSAENFLLLLTNASFMWTNSDGASQQEFGIFIARHIFQHILHFIRRKLQEFMAGAHADIDFSTNGEFLAREMKASVSDYLLKTPEILGKMIPIQLISLIDMDEIVERMLFADPRMSFLSMKYNIKLSSTDRCSPAMILQRPLHPHHMVVLYLCESVSSYSDALDRERMCWPGRLVVCDTSSMQVVSVSSTFDAGALYLLPDGVHCITYRLKVFNIETGDLVRELDPEDSVVLIDMVATPDRRLVIGKQLEMLRDLETMGDIAKIASNNDENNPDRDNFLSSQSTRGSRVIQAYNSLDGTLVFNYRFEFDPLALLVPSNGRLVILLRDHPIQLFEIVDPTERSSAEAIESALLRIDSKNANAVLVSEILKSDYLNFLKSVLTQGLARVAESRPPDPIEFLARWLLQFAAAQSAGLN